MTDGKVIDVQVHAVGGPVELLDQFKACCEMTEVMIKMAVSAKYLNASISTVDQEINSRYIRGCI